MPSRDVRLVGAPGNSGSKRNGIRTADTFGAAKRTACIHYWALSPAEFVLTRSRGDV